MPAPRTPPQEPNGTDWRCVCPSRPLLGTVIGGALQVRIPLPLHYPDRVVVRCPSCRRIQVFRLD